MRKEKIKRIIITVLAIAVSLITIERLYNSRAEFQTTAKDATYYGILDAKYTSREKSKDFEFLHNLLEENYPFFRVNERLNNINWLENKNRYKRIIRNTENDAEYFVALNNILKELDDDNTYILTGDLYRRNYKHYFPNRREIFHYERSIARYDFDGDIGNIQLDPNNNFIFHNGPVLETKVLIEDKLAYMKIEAMSYYHIDEDYLKIKSFLKEVEDYDKLIIDIRGNSGGCDEYWTNIVQLLIDDVHSAEYYSFFKQNAKTVYDIFKVPSIYTIRDLDEKVLQQFPPEIKTDFNFYKINQVQIAPKENVKFRGKVYLLVDREVYSSAEKFAAFSKDTGFATLVGETTGGGMTFADVPMTYMPLSGFIVNYSRELVLNADGSINMETKTIPHMVVDDSIPNEDFNKDKCIQAVIEDKI
ncbi:S41 family peptidase [Proteiniborus sp.]|uniref:S41 family peptidase n=1 Tax=Proteiniborus sp. TaxID=2079015 RepID=UPI00332E6D64